MFSLIVAIADNNVIGNQNKLIWHLPADLKFFRNVTMGLPIIMGRKTFDSIGRPLPGRRNIVISRDSKFNAMGVEVINDIHTVKRIVNEAEEAIIIGGAEIYRLLLPLCDRMYITRVHHNFVGDTFFPEINFEDWNLVSADAHQADEKNAYNYTFLVYDRKK